MPDLTFKITIRDYEPGTVGGRLDTADVEEAIQARLDEDASDGIVIVEEVEA